jgi:hypothetical protein
MIALDSSSLDTTTSRHGFNSCRVIRRDGTTDRLNLEQYPVHGSKLWPHTTQLSSKIRQEHESDTGRAKVDRVTAEQHRRELQDMIATLKRQQLEEIADGEDPVLLEIQNEPTVHHMATWSEKQYHEYKSYQAERELVLLQDLMQVGARLQTQNTERTSTRVLWETVVHPTINSLEAMIPPATANALKKPTAEALTNGLGQSLQAPTIGPLMSNMMGPLNEYITADTVNTAAKPTSMHVNNRLREELKTTTNFTVNSGLGKQLTNDLTGRLTDTMSRMLGHQLSRGLTRTMTRHVNSAMIPGLTLPLVPTLTKALTRTGGDDNMCYLCQQNGQNKAACDMCKNQGDKDKETDRQDRYYSNYYSQYYTQFYSGYASDRFALQYEENERLGKNVNPDTQDVAQTHPI